MKNSNPKRIIILLAISLLNHSAFGASKTPVSNTRSRSCHEIKNNLDSFSHSNILKTTRYFTPYFDTDPRDDKTLRHACFNIEGSCISPGLLHNYPDQTISQSQTSCLFGFGNGKSSSYNRTNCLAPCTTIAADQKIYPKGTVLYIPEMDGKICPQTGQPVDGCFVVGDVGSAIKGDGRFDLYVGECSNYSTSTNTCRDSDMKSFGVSPNTEFYVIPRDHEFSEGIRNALDSNIRNWKNTVQYTAESFTAD